MFSLQKPDRKAGFLFLRSNYNYLPFYIDPRFIFHHFFYFTRHFFDIASRSTTVVHNDKCLRVMNAGLSEFLAFQSADLVDDPGQRDLDAAVGFRKTWK